MSKLSISSDLQAASITRFKSIFCNLFSKSYTVAIKSLGSIINDDLLLLVQLGSSKANANTANTFIVCTTG